MKNILRSFGLKKLMLLSSVALAILLGLSFLGYTKIRDKEETSRWVGHTLETITVLEALHGSILKVANAQRFYVISQKAAYRVDFNESLQHQIKQLMLLENLFSDNAEQLKNVKAAGQKISDLILYFKKTLNMLDSGKQAEVIKFINEGVGAKLLEMVELDLVEMKKIERNLLKQRLADEAYSRRSGNNFLFISTFGGILTVLSFILLGYRANLRREIIQKELNQNSQVQKAILQAAAYALIATDEIGRITHFNPAAEKLLGYQKEEVLGKTPILFHDPLEVANMSTLLSERFNERIPLGFDVFTHAAKQNTIESNQWTFIRKDNSRVQVLLTVSPLTDVDGQITGFLAIGNDISKQLESERALTQAKEDALAGTKAKSEFLANMSHEIRTPMNAILGMAELLNESELNDDQRKYVHIFQSAGASLLNIINDILDLSKIESGHFELDPNPVNLSQLISQVTEIMATKAHQKDLELVVDQESDLPEDFLADGQRLRQIMLNLIGNAVKFTRKGEILLNVSAGPILNDGRQQINIEVRDTGIGMTDDQLKNIFHRFSQADSSITKEFGGTGLGLNITRKLVEMMDGKIDVQSTYGVGTRFLVQVKLTPQLITEVSEEKVSLKGLTFLIVDDNKTNRLIVRKILENQGAQVNEADGGESAWELVQKQTIKFDMILIDRRMPKIDGFTLAEKILKEDKGKEALLMMLTSDSRPDEITRSRQIGIKSLLVKPILKIDLLNAIERVLGHSVEKDKLEHPTNVSATLSPGLSLLLVDDNDDNRLIIKAFLKESKFQIDEARNGEEALRFFSKNPYHLILMDMQMPVMDGYTAVREMRKLELEDQLEYTPVVALSAFALKEEIERSYHAGCDAHLAKPVSKKDLLKMILNKTTSIIEEVPSDMQDILPDYLAGRKDEAIILSNALLNKDLKTLQSIGHKIAGAAGSYGLMKLTEIGQRIESGARTLDMALVALAVADYKLYLKQLQVSYVLE